MKAVSEKMPPDRLGELILGAARLVWAYLRGRYPAGSAVILGELKAIAGVDERELQTDGEPGRGYTYAQLQETLSKLNEKEKENIRKRKGVYYTPNDVVRFILANSVKASFGRLTADNISDMDPDGVPGRAWTVFDPTCGAGEFLLAALEMKLTPLVRNGRAVSDREIRQAVSAIYGNDINPDSVKLTQLRLLLCAAERCGAGRCGGLAGIMKSRFTTCDFVGGDIPPGTRFHVIVGNPPYVEDANSGLAPAKKYGNIYANVLINAAKRLEKNGALGFVVPLSYVSTPRMKRLREELAALVPEQYILSFADRPDCLFDRVHQKLCILIGRDTASPRTVYTGNYQYWYKEERADLFRGLRVIENAHWCDGFIPKLGTRTDAAIFEKVTDPAKTVSIFDRSRTGPESVYLNRRETFWMKAYRTPIDDPEYKAFHFMTAREADFCYCVINSSLFWWYWTCVSDCWHVSRSLNGFRMPAAPDYGGVAELAAALMDRLEATKVYVGTKQTQYEYKHRACLDEIRAIDDYVNAAYGLTGSESEYIKAFAFRYRTSGGIGAGEGD